MSTSSKRYTDLVELKGMYRFKCPSLMDGSAQALVIKHKTASRKEKPIEIGSMYGYLTTPSRGGCSGGTCIVSSVASGSSGVTKIYNV